MGVFSTTHLPPTSSPYPSTPLNFFVVSDSKMFCMLPDKKHAFANKNSCREEGSVFWCVSVLAGVCVECVCVCVCMHACAHAYLHVLEGCVCMCVLDTVCTCMCVLEGVCVCVGMCLFVGFFEGVCLCVSLYVFIGKCALSVGCRLSPWLSLLPWLNCAEKVMSKQTCLTPHIRKMITYPSTSLCVGPVSVVNLSFTHVTQNDLVFAY